MDLRSTADHVRRHPGMWFAGSEPTFAECLAFLHGWDAATGRAALAGFKGWLVARAGQQWGGSS